MNKRFTTLILCMMAAFPGTLTANDQTGRWGPVLEWNINPIHAVLTPEKKLLTFGQGGGVEYSVWDPTLGTGPESRSLLPNNTPTDLFCSSQIVLPGSGTVMMAGGDQPGPTFIGNPGTTFFNESDDSMLDAGYTMASPRWYPTLTTLPNGEILVQGGRDQEDPLIPILTPEVYNPTMGWRSLLGINSEYAYSGSKWWYPRSWVIPNGLVFGITGKAMYYLDYQNDGKLLKAGTFEGPNTFEPSTAVMYQPGKILQLGGGSQGNVTDSEATNLATLVDVNGAEPVVTDAAPINLARHWADSTVLPDGTVLVTGGSQRDNTFNGDGPAFAAELWNPNTNQWQLLASEIHPRLYHSFAILLPDATILSAGGGEPGPVTNRNGQVFSPPYLFNGNELASRPQITLDTTRLVYGDAITVNRHSDHAISRLTLLKAGAVTHSFNNDQRFIEVPFTQTDNGNLIAEMPASPYIATPGYYYLFALDTNGVPSVAQYVHFPPDEDLQLAALPELVDPQDLLQNCVYPADGGWGWDAVADASCRPQTVTTDSSDACDYSNAEMFGGFGWNPITQRSCRPLNEVVMVPQAVVDACDYSRADEYNGWGFNPVSSESCPPLDNNEDNVTTTQTVSTEIEPDNVSVVCIDSDGDGWGWDGSDSCRID